MKKVFLAFLVVMLSVSFCFGKSKKKKDTSINTKQEKTEEIQEGLKYKVAIARFSNETQYAKGAFYDRENDPLKKQCVDILSTKLAATKKFILLERADLELLQAEQEYQGLNFEKVGADYLLIGSMTEYGRKTEGVSAIVGGSKTQIVECAVSIRLVDVSTGQIIYSEEGKGQADTKSVMVLGAGKAKGFDATLADKAISDAVENLVANIVKTCENRPWKSYFIAYDSDMILISGGEHQGIKAGTEFKVMEKGKRVKNPQTGIMMQLPGKEVGKIKVLSTGGDTVENEYSIVEFVSGSISPNDFAKYEITDR